MREIKFRGKRIDGQGWIYGWLRQSGNQDIQKSNGQYIRTEKYYQIQDDKYNSQFIVEDTIGQYTGLKDKNGKEIYEGDILNIPEWLICDNQNKCICIYNQENTVSDIIGYGLYIKDEYSGKYKILVNSDEWDEFEVIGNIYENPELLEE